MLYPKLKCVRTVLKEITYDVKEDDRDKIRKKEVFQEELKNVLRLCLAPIALAIDSLHNPIPGRRYSIT